MKRRGIVKGQAIEFDEPIGLRDGQSVEIDIDPVEEAAPVDSGDDAAYQSPAYRTFRPIPARGNLVTNEMVNELREQMGF